jgi:hypothetical protein
VVEVTLGLDRVDLAGTLKTVFGALQPPANIHRRTGVSMRHILGAPVCGDVPSGKRQ